MTRLLLSFAWMVLVIAIGGCSEDMAIRTYKVAKQTTESGASQSPQLKEARMLGVIIPNEGNAWFLKLMDEPTKVQAVASEFRQLADSIKFDTQGTPSWNLAEGWQEKILQQITYAKFIHVSGIEGTLTQLAANTGDTASWEEYVKENVNRWRNQLSLSPQEWNAMQSELVPCEEQSTPLAKAYFVSLTGKRVSGASGMSGRAPFLEQMQASEAKTAASLPDSASSSSQSSTAASATAPPTTTQPRIQYQVPEGWQEKPAGGFRLASFEIKQQEQLATVAVSIAGGELNASIGMWLQAVGLEPNAQSVQQIEQAASTGTANEVSYRIFFIKGEGDKATALRIAMIPIGSSNQNLYVKMSGPMQLIEEQSTQMDQFVGSLRW